MPQASLCFIIQDDRVLLIRKKRGVGAGKINGPGGKVEAGETMLDSAVRETREEIGVTPRDLELRGELFFDFVGSHVVHCGVFLARSFDGAPVETDEAIPIWHSTASMPYGEMWEDDRVWFPLLLAGKHFRGGATVDPGDKVRDIHAAEINASDLAVSCSGPVSSGGGVA
jgi:8-oxo-dGTP diphosphatase